MVPSTEQPSPDLWALTLLKVNQHAGSLETHSSFSFLTLSYENVFLFLGSGLPPATPGHIPLICLSLTWAARPAGDKAGGEAAGRMRILLT